MKKRNCLVGHFGELFGGPFCGLLGGPWWAMVAFQFATYWAARWAIWLANGGPLGGPFSDELDMNDELELWVKKK